MKLTAKAPENGCLDGNLPIFRCENAKFHGGQKNPFPVDQRPVFCSASLLFAGMDLSEQSELSGEEHVTLRVLEASTPKIRWRLPKELKELLNLHSSNLT